MITLTDADGNPPNEGDEATTITFTCPRSAHGKPRRCTHPLGTLSGEASLLSRLEAILCPGCGWKGRIEAGALVTEGT